MHRSQEALPVAHPGDGLHTHKGPRSARRCVLARGPPRTWGGTLVAAGRRAGLGHPGGATGALKKGLSLPSLLSCLTVCHLRLRHRALGDPARLEALVPGRPVRGCPPCGARLWRPARRRTVYQPRSTTLTFRVCACAPGRWERAGRRWDTTCMTWSGQRRSSARWRCATGGGHPAVTTTATPHTACLPRGVLVSRRRGSNGTAPRG